jgi:hypothetical protein
MIPLPTTTRFAPAHGVESDEGKHKKKWDQYQVEKPPLISNSWSVLVNPPSQQRLDVGVKVEERSGLKRRGVIIQAEEGGSLQTKSWCVLFEDEDKPRQGIRSTMLQLIKDKRIFEWKIVKDSTPDKPAFPFKNVGVVNFNFDDFAPAKTDFKDNDFEQGLKNEFDYNFPYLRLLIKLWPGKLRGQVLFGMCHFLNDLSIVHRRLGSPTTNFEQ